MVSTKKVCRSSQSMIFTHYWYKPSLLINFVTTYSNSLIFRKSLVEEGQNGNSKTLCFTSKRKKHHFQYASLQSSLSFFSRVYYYYFHSERCIAFHKMPSVVRQSANFIFTIYPSKWMNFLFFSMTHTWLITQVSIFVQLRF